MGDEYLRKLSVFDKLRECLTSGLRGIRHHCSGRAGHPLHGSTGRRFSYVVIATESVAFATKVAPLSLRDL